MSDPWTLMDDWCKQKGGAVTEKALKLRESGCQLEDPSYREMLGQSNAFHRMRAFIHGHRNSLEPNP